MSNTTNNNSSNPFSDSGSQMVLQVPKQIKIKLVNSSELSNLKIWSALASFFSNCSVGFWVWFIQNTDANLCTLLKIFSILLTVVTFIFICMSFYFNHKLKQETSEISYSPNQ